jgi:AraC-like DNA-binding protein
VQGISESIRHLPRPPLADYVAWYSGYRQAGVGPMVHRGLPGPHLTLIFTLHEPLTVAAHPDPAQAPDVYQTLIGGLHTVPAVITHEGRQSGIQVALSPLGARAILGLPAGEIATADLHGAELLGPSAAELQARLQAAPRWDERFAILDAHFIGRLAGSGGPPAQVERAWRRIAGSGGLAQVGSIAAEVGWSARYLRLRFETEIGLSPKTAARVVRFDRARRLLVRQAASDHPIGLADLAARCGYFDQAHLCREFGRFAGRSPLRWLAGELRNVQYGPWDEAAELTA